MQEIKTQILVIGAGIAGLWLLSKLQEQGYDAILCEKNALGSGQTIASQGIIHGGMKYSLTGKVTASSSNIAGMPKIWEECTNGTASPDFKHVNILSPYQYLWTTQNISSELTAFFASKIVQNRMEKLLPDNYPSVFKNDKFKNSIYRLTEQVLDIPSVLNVFHKILNNNLIHTDNIRFFKKGTGQYGAYMTTINKAEYKINAAHIICLAGEGNEELLKETDFNTPIMQRRPLHMLLMRGKLPAIYGHALGMDNLPRITITSHFDKNGKTVWYMGGRPAEKGVDMSANELIQKTKKELNKLIPWVDTSNTEWATWKIDRAEGFQKNGSRPDVPILKWHKNICVAWPTKLAFAPLLSDLIIDWIKKENTVPEIIAHNPALPIPPVATPIWDRNDLTWS